MIFHFAPSLLYLYPIQGWPHFKYEPFLNIMIQLEGASTQAISFVSLFAKLLFPAFFQGGNQRKRLLMYQRKQASTISNLEPLLDEEESFGLCQRSQNNSLPRVYRDGGSTQCCLLLCASSSAWRMLPSPMKDPSWSHLFSTQVDFCPQRLWFTNNLYFRSAL